MTTPTPAKAAPEVTEAVCPHCSEPLSMETVSSLMDSSRMSFRVSPHEGELLSAKTVGGTITQVANLLTAVGKDLGVKTNVVIEGVAYDAGSVTVNLLVTRHQPGIRKRKAEKEPSR